MTLTCHGLSRAALAVLIAGAACVFPRAVLALDPTIETLRSELRELFPAPAASRQPSVAPASTDVPYAIVRREYLYARPVDLPGRPVIPSMALIRALPAPVRQAHAACVKVLTPYWHGAGVLVSSSGDVLTSYHLVAGVTTASVQTLDGRIHPVAAVQAYSAADDLALLHIDGDGYPVLALATHTPPGAGSSLSVVGHPGDRSWTLSTGRAIRRVSDSGTRVLHFDSDVGRGNSGGPIIDSEGRLCAITACMAELADGSRVKVGIDAEAIAAFLGRGAGHPVSLPDLADLERNRQAAEFLQLIYGLTDDLLADWQSVLSDVDIEARTSEVPPPAPPRAGSMAPAPASPAPAVSFTRPNRTTDIAARVLVLQLLLSRCREATGLNPSLLRSMETYAAVLDRMLDASELLARRTATADDVRTRLRKAAEMRGEAAAGFGSAVTTLQEAGRTFGLTPESSRSCALLERVRTKYVPGGCHVPTGDGGG